MLNLDPAYISLIGQIVAYVISILIAIWRVSARFARTEEVLKSTARTLEKVVSSQKKLISELSAMEIKLSEREKEIMKLDASIEATRRDIFQLIKDYQKNFSTLEALWLTMQNLFPDKVPQRITDRK